MCFCQMLTEKKLIFKPKKIWITILIQKEQRKTHLTSPALSFSPIIFLCSDRWIIISGAKSIPVFPGTLYNMTGIGLVSATWNKGDNYKFEDSYFFLINV